MLHDDFTTFEIIGHYNEPQSQQLSESAVNRLPDGTWMAICRNDAGNYHFTTSQDGKTWTVGEPKPCVPNGLNSKPTFHQSVGMFDGSCSNWYVRCDDPDAERPEWTEPIYLGFGASLNKPIVRTNGEWILPVSLWERWHIDEPFADCYRELDAVRGANVFVSDDEGRHWRYRGGIVFKDSCFNEHSVVELYDGRLWMLSRGMKEALQSYSADGGKTWQPQSTAFPHVNSKCVIRHLQSGSILLIRHGQDITKATPARQELTAFLITDEGKTWSGGLLLDQRTGVSYPDIANSMGM